MSVVDRFASEPPACCAVCRRRAYGIGFGLNPTPTTAAVVHCCYDPACVRTVHRVATMSDEQFDAHEKKAIGDAGESGGAYLDQIGKTDLAMLTPRQWNEFLEQVLHGFEISMRRQMQNAEAPF